jgi:hypothetical protein
VSTPTDDASLGIGTDEWVARHGERLSSKTGLLGNLQNGFGKIPGTARWIVALLIAIAVPLETNNGYIMRVGVNLGLFIVLSYGLNIVVGYAGLLDLGYAAFYGFGAYGYALLSSEQLGHHWPTYIGGCGCNGTSRVPREPAFTSTHGRLSRNRHSLLRSSLHPSRALVRQHHFPMVQ